MAISQAIIASTYGDPQYRALVEHLCSLTFTAAGFTTAALGDLKVGRIPAGRWLIRTDLSRLNCPAGTATSDLDLGLAAFVKPDGTTQALQGALLADSLDVGGGAINQNLSAVAPQIVDSRDGIDVVASFDTANSPAAGLLVLSLVLQKL